MAARVAYRVMVTLTRRIFAVLIAAAYVGTTALAAAAPIGSCPALEAATPAARHHHGGRQSGHQHKPHDKPGKAAGECPKCCLGTCLVGPSLPTPTTAGSDIAFSATPVVYWLAVSAISDRAVAPDPGPPRPIA